MRVHINIAKARELGLPIPEGAQTLIEYEVSLGGDGLVSEDAHETRKLADMLRAHPGERLTEVLGKRIREWQAQNEERMHAARRDWAELDSAEVSSLRQEISDLHRKAEQSESLRLEQVGLAASEIAELRAKLGTPATLSLPDLAKPPAPPAEPPAPPEPKEPAEPMRKRGGRQ